MPEFLPVFKEAKRRLKEDPFDAGHDFDHHLAVVTNCLAIVAEENLDLDINALLVAAWWHDYKRNEEDENDRIVTETMLKADFGQDYIHKVLSIKNSHSFGNGQESLEERVLFDADKLEYTSADRMKKVSDAVKKGEMTLETQQKYRIAFEDRIGKVVNQLHFDYSKNEIRKRIDHLKKVTKNDPLWTGIVDGL